MEKKYGNQIKRCSWWSRFIIFLLQLITLARPSTAQVNGRIMNLNTKQPIAGATIRNLSDSIIQFSNEDGSFRLGHLDDTTHIRISCLGYTTRVIPLDSIKMASVIELQPVTYSLPPVFVGNYAQYLIRAAYRKADSMRGIYFYGIGYNLQFLWLNGRPAEYYAFLQKDKLSIEGLIAREIVAAQHRPLLTGSDSNFSISSFRSYGNGLNWYYKSDNVKKLFRKF